MAHIQPKLEKLLRQDELPAMEHDKTSTSAVALHSLRDADAALQLSGNSAFSSSEQQRLPQLHYMSTSLERRLCEGFRCFF